jgi:hypothetical protein
MMKTGAIEVSLTDPDSRSMPVGRGHHTEVAFNISQCTQKKSGGRRTTRFTEERMLDDMERRNRLHPEKLKRRKDIVEHPFGTMKRSMNQGYILMRGVEKVKAEMSLTVTTHKLKRALNILGVNRMVQALV